MSRCSCEASTSYRVTGEVIEDRPDSSRSGDIGSGEKMVRIRCGECGGKVTYVGSDLLLALGIPKEGIYAGRVLGEDERPTLEVDLI